MTTPASAPPFKYSPASLALAVLLLAAGYLAFRAGVDYTADWIWTQPEWGHALLIPFISAFLIWQKRDELAALPFQGSWVGIALLALGLAVNLVGSLASLFILQQYAILLALYGLALACIGAQGVRVIWVPLLLLVFMIPLPHFLQQALSANLQLISSQIGVWFIRLFGISVMVVGNVIDLGVYRLQVAEACDGLRYLFPLMTLGFIMAYFYKAPFWKRAVLFLSSVPITILMNSIRVGTIGVMVEYWGIQMAEGFLHEFQGWAVFMVSVVVMLGEVMLLSRIGRDARPWRAQFGLEFPPPRPRGAAFRVRSVPATAWTAAGLLAVSAVAMTLLPQRAEDIPERSDFTAFPARLGDWNGRFEPMEQVYVDALKFDDYLMANYAKPASRPVNFYVAWYDSQRAGRSAHSPRSCLPGGGWEIRSLAQVDVPGVQVGGRPLRVNRALIQLGEQKQLVYYWFQQRGRIVTNEYLVKWYLFWDSLTRNRSDGALIRLIVPLTTADSEAKAEAELREFATVAAGSLPAWVPG